MVKKHIKGLLFYLHIGQSSSGSKFKTPTQLFWKSFKVTRVPQGDEGRGRGRGTTVCHLRQRKEKGAGLHLPCADAPFIQVGLCLQGR